MKNLIQHKLSQIVFLLFISLFLGCAPAEDAHDDHAGHDHEEETHSDDKEVHLNRAQFENAGIKLGNFSMKNLSEVVNANGYTNLAPSNQADVSFPVDGTIKSIKVIAGDYVKKGQTLATMSSMAYNNLLLERSKLKEEKDKAESDLVYLQDEYNRQEKLFESGAVTLKDFQRMTSELNFAKTTKSSAQEQIQIINQTLNQISSSGSSNISISAPIAGYVTQVNVRLGSMIEAGTVMFSLGDNSKMHMDLLVYEKDLGKVKAGQKVRFVLTNQSNQEITGSVYSIGKAFENDTKSVAVHAEIDENNASLIPGMYVNALIDIGTREVKALPEDAVIMTEGRKFVYVLKSDPHAGHDHGEEEDHSGHDHGEEEDHSGHDHGEEEDHSGHDHGEEEDHTGHDHGEEEEYQFYRVEVMTGPSQLGFIQVTPVQKMNKGDKIVLDGAYYIQSQLQKSEGGGGHSH